MVVFSRISSIPIICIMLCAFNAAASDDLYLKALEDEASELSLDIRSQKKDTVKHNTGADSNITEKQWAWEGELIGDVLPKGLAQDEFATLLEQHFYGSFVFYRRLNVIDQESIYMKYKEYVKPDINSIRRAILKLSK